MVREGHGGPLQLHRSCHCGGSCGGCGKGGDVHREEEPELRGELGVQRSCGCGGSCGGCSQGELHSEEEGELKGELSGGAATVATSVQRAEAKPKRAEAPTLRIGSSSPFVLELQRLLVQNGAQLNGDGKFGPQTLKAVKEYQRSHGLTPDGIVGRRTWHSLEGGGGAGQAGGGDHAAVLAKLQTAQEAIRSLNTPAPAQAGAPAQQPAAAETAGVGFLDDEWEAAKEAAGAVADAASSTYDAAAEGVSNVVDSVRDTANDVIDSVVDAATGAAETVGEAASAAGKWASSTASNVGDWAGKQADAAGEWVENEVTKPAAEFVEAAGKKAEEIGSDIAAVAEGVRKQFGEAFDAMDKALQELGKELEADWDAVSKWLDTFLAGVAGAAAANHTAATPDALPDGCTMSVEAVPLGRDTCPVAKDAVEPDELDKAMGKPSLPAGALFTYDYPRLIMGGTCPISLDGAKLTETVTSDGAVSGKSGVRTGTCPINTDGSIPDCKDTYGICLPQDQLVANMKGRSTATETFTQQLFVQGTLVETHQIKFRFWREGPFVSVTDITRD